MWYVGEFLDGCCQSERECVYTSDNLSTHDVDDQSSKQHVWPVSLAPAGIVSSHVGKYTSSRHHRLPLSVAYPETYFEGINLLRRGSSADAETARPAILWSGGAQRSVSSHFAVSRFLGVGLGLGLGVMVRVRGYGYGQVMGNGEVGRHRREGLWRPGQTFILASASACS